MSKRSSPDSVIDLTLDDDDDGSRPGDARKDLTNTYKNNYNGSKKKSRRLNNDDESGSDSKLPSRWTCSVCTYRQSTRNENCTLCTAPRKPEDTTVEWSCSRCTFRQCGPRTSCVMCGPEYMLENVSAAGTAVENTNRKQDSAPGIKTENAAPVGASLSSNNNKQDDVEVVEAPAPEMVAAEEEEAIPDGGADDVVMVGTKNACRLPHMRPHCTKFKFQINKSFQNTINKLNVDHCDLCYCYVCDCPVDECENWRVHCNATDQEQSWVRRRQNKLATRNKQQSTAANSLAEVSAPRRSTVSPLSSLRGDTRRSTSSSLSWLLGDHPPGHRKVVGVSYIPMSVEGPLEPDHQLAPKDANFTKCYKCSWYSRRLEKDNPWCRKCGYVASPSFKNPLNCKRPKPSNGDFCFGKKKIHFRIVSRDVRSMGKYKDFWNNQQTETTAVTFDESEMEADVFERRLGKHPTIDSILRLVSSLDEGALKDMAKNWDSGDCDPYSCKNENVLEGIVLGNRDDLALLQVLSGTQSIGRTTNMLKITERELVGSLKGEVKAKWDKQKRSGEIIIRVYLPPSCLGGRNLDAEFYNLFLGSWFSIFPFHLSDLTGARQAEPTKFIEDPSSRVYLSAPPFKVRRKDEPELFKSAVKRLELACSTHNKAVEEFSSKLSLTSGSGSKGHGSIASSGTKRPDMKSIFQAFYREKFTEFLGQRYGGPYRFLELERGLLSSHRSANSSSPNDFDSNSTLDVILNFEDRALARSCKFPDASYQRDIDSSNILDYVENLGHEAEVDCEGLTCELLPFQKQSLRWALERELVAGGIQSYFLVRVPVHTVTATKQWKKTFLYYNLISNRFSATRPQEVRGGIIAEEMGLGKTVISLGLILKNPAPANPISGSPLSSLSTPSQSGAGASQWNTKIKCVVPGRSKHRGSIVSRGTLVICPVSLVGQWIEEAKSKLKNPGLVYPYHGGNRKRNAEVLAKNAIVVTTYQVLASDDTYWRKQSNDPDYCPPLEQILWWRIICDEGHSLKAAHTSRNVSISNLVAQNRWLVSGTPISSSIKDLKNQLSFLGIQSIESIFKAFTEGRSGDILCPGELLFFLRNILMRHSQAMKYRDTDTTLMSLPAKTERSIEVTLSSDENNQYDQLDNAAKTFYLNFKAAHRGTLSSHYLLLSQKLTPMRVACSGGYYPLNDGNDDLEPDDDDDDSEEKPRAKRKEVKYSDFAFTSKFNVLLSELERIRDEDPSSKSLVFSQYASTLNWLKEELPKHGFQFRTLSGSMTMKARAKALHDFQQDPPMTIFLLSMRSGNCGINLTQANRVFIMEPGFNPALEQQAVGRVHRLGQKREVEVVRFLIKDSVETRIRNFLQHKYGSSSSGGKDDGSGDEKKDEAGVAVGPVGNQCSERPKSAIVAQEFDVLFGVEGMKFKTNHDDEAMPDATPSSSGHFI